MTERPFFRIVRKGAHDDALVSVCARALHDAPILLQDDVTELVLFELAPQRDRPVVLPLADRGLHGGGVAIFPLSSVLGAVERPRAVLVGAAREDGSLVVLLRLQEERPPQHALVRTSVEAAQRRERRRVFVAQLADGDGTEGGEGALVRVVRAVRVLVLLHQRWVSEAGLYRATRDDGQSHVQARAPRLE